MKIKTYPLQFTEEYLKHIEEVAKKQGKTIKDFILEAIKEKIERRWFFLNNYNVYKHTFPDGKIYIGVSTNPLKRWSNGHGYYFNEELDKAIKEVGWENIKHEILFDRLSKEEAEQKEIELISFYNSNNKNKGFNKSKGGRIIVKQKTKIHKKTKSITIDKELMAKVELLCATLNRNFSNFVESLLKEEIKKKNRCK